MVYNKSMPGIIPKPIKRTPKWHNIALYAALGLIVLLVLGYALLFYFEGKTQSILTDLEDQIAQVGTREEKRIETQLLLQRKTINDFAKLFQEHKKASAFFEFIENSCHPKVWFTQLTLSPEDAQANFSGQTVNFQTLGQQILIFQEHDSIESIQLSSLTINDEGETEFTFTLSLDPQMFK